MDTSVFVIRAFKNKTFVAASLVLLIVITTLSSSSFPALWLSVQGKAWPICGNCDVSQTDHDFVPVNDPYFRTLHYVCIEHGDSDIKELKTNNRTLVSYMHHHTCIT